MRTWLAALGKLGRLGWDDWRALWEAQRAIIRARRVVRDTPLGALPSALPLGTDDASAARPDDAETVARLGAAVERIARHGLGRPLCLVRSIAYHDLLQRHGIPGSRLRIGVRMTRLGRFEAHAWVEWNGAVAGEDPGYVAAFQPISALDSGVAPLDVLRQAER